MKRIEELTPDTFIDVFNNTQGSIGYTIPGGRSRVWEAPTRLKLIVSQKVKFSEMQDAISVPSIYEMFDAGKLLIRDATVREALELPELDSYTLDSKQLLEFFEDSTEEEFEEMISYCSNAMFAKIVDMAIQNPLSSTKKARMIEQFSGKDVLKLSKELEEEVADAPKLTEQRRVVKKQEESKPVEGALRSKIK